MTLREPYQTQLVQLGLHAQGFDVGKLDGHWGPRTQAAFDEYVKRNREMMEIPNYARWADCLTRAQGYDMGLFRENWKKNRPRYDEVSVLAGVPSGLVAALHWREASGDFKKYLHQGDPLGRPAVHVPKDIPIFHLWEPAAVHALKMKETLRVELDLTAASRNLNAMCAFAESYNGMGYRRRGVASPYVLAGTDGYISGKYVTDGRYDPDAVDRQLGVLPMLRACSAG